MLGTFSDPEPSPWGFPSCREPGTAEAGGELAVPRLLRAEGDRSSLLP